jgi:hypothetical protein
MFCTVFTAETGRRGIEKRNHMMSSYLQNWPLSGTDTESDEDSLLETYNGGARFQQTKAGGGVAYVRWGHTSCSAGAETVYSGRVGGSHFYHRGGGSNYQCLTLEPENEDFGPSTTGAEGSLMYGSEYEVLANNPSVDKSLSNHDVPCAVCYVSTRSAKIMIPGTYKCPSSWNEEFHGFLMSAHNKHQRTTFECVDTDAKKALAGHANANGALFYFVEPRCGSLPCPPYEQEKELSCAVCTR